jgi:hypothetical protein
MGGCPETKGVDAGASDGRQEEAPPRPGGPRAHHRGDEEAVGGGQEGKGDGENQPRRSNRRRRRSRRGRRLPDEGGAEATGREEGARQEGCRDGGGGGWERIEGAVEAAAGQRLAPLYKAWIAADPSAAASGCSSPGRQGFERTVAFAETKRVARSPRRRMAAEKAPAQPRGPRANHRGDEDLAQADFYGRRRLSGRPRGGHKAGRLRRRRWRRHQR